MTKRRRDQSSRSAAGFMRVLERWQVPTGLKKKVFKHLGSLSTHVWDKRKNSGITLSLSLPCFSQSCIPAATQHLLNFSVWQFSDLVTWFCDCPGLVTKHTLLDLSSANWIPVFASPFPTHPIFSPGVVSDYNPCSFTKWLYNLGKSFSQPDSQFSYLQNDGFGWDGFKDPFEF